MDKLIYKQMLADEMSTINELRDKIEQIKTLIEDNANDDDLGKKIRTLNFNVDKNTGIIEVIRHDNFKSTKGISTELLINSCNFLVCCLMPSFTLNNILFKNIDDGNSFNLIFIFEP